jgi:hypothetical protein
MIGFLMDTPLIPLSRWDNWKSFFRTTLTKPTSDNFVVKKVCESRDNYFNGWDVEN